MVFKDKEIEQSLTKKGFKKEPKDHRYYVLYVNGKKTKVKTHTSHCGQDINDPLINLNSLLDVVTTLTVRHV